MLYQSTGIALFSNLSELISFRQQRVGLKLLLSKSRGHIAPEVWAGACVSYLCVSVAKLLSSSRPFNLFVDKLFTLSKVQRATRANFHQRKPLAQGANRVARRQRWPGQPSCYPVRLNLTTTGGYAVIATRYRWCWGRLTYLLSVIKDFITVKRQDSRSEWPF